jgi:hypothetical protein
MNKEGRKARSGFESAPFYLSVAARGQYRLLCSDKSSRAPRFVNQLESSLVGINLDTVVGGLTCSPPQGVIEGVRSQGKELQAQANLPVKSNLEGEDSRCKGNDY